MKIIIVVVAAFLSGCVTVGRPEPGPELTEWVPVRGISTFRKFCPGEVNCCYDKKHRRVYLREDEKGRHDPCFVDLREEW